MVKTLKPVKLTNHALERYVERVAKGVIKDAQSMKQINGVKQQSTMERS